MVPARLVAIIACICFLGASVLPAAQLACRCASKTAASGETAIPDCCKRAKAPFQSCPVQKGPLGCCAAKTSSQPGSAGNSFDQRCPVCSQKQPLDVAAQSGLQENQPTGQIVALAASLSSVDHYNSLPSLTALIGPERVLPAIGVLLRTCAILC
jgi:hypothetical protein